jgi:hypothetical protein
MRSCRSSPSTASCSRRFVAKLCDDAVVPDESVKREDASACVYEEADEVEIQSAKDLGVGVGRPPLPPLPHCPRVGRAAVGPREHREPHRGVLALILLLLAVAARPRAAAPCTLAASSPCANNSVRVRERPTHTKGASSPALHHWNATMRSTKSVRAGADPFASSSSLPFRGGFWLGDGKAGGSDDGNSAIGEGCV